MFRGLNNCQINDPTKYFNRNTTNAFRYVIYLVFIFFSFDSWTYIFRACTKVYAQTVHHAKQRHDPNTHILKGKQNNICRAVSKAKLYPNPQT